MDLTTVTSEAYNLSSLTSAVNERTGGVDVSVSLGRISAGLQDPVSFELIIYSNPGNPSLNYFGFGGNWLINSPRIDFRNQVIYLSNGKSVRYTGNFMLEYRRLKDIRIESKLIIEGSVSYRNTVITHKNGTVEYYNDLGIITQLVSTSGQRLHFTYESEPGELYHALSRVHDGQGNQLSIDYGVALPGSTERVVTVIQDVAGERSVTKVYIQRNINQDIVKSISLPNNVEQRFYFDYTSKDGQVYLSRIKSPTGKVQEFNYSAINYNSARAVNVVSTLKTMGNNPAKSELNIVTYEYSNNNFTGYPLGRRQVLGRDNALYRTDEFTYSVTEVHNDIKIKRTFNRFHLLIEEDLLDTQTGVRQSLTSYTYPTVASQDITGQPEQFALWTKKTTKYANAAGESREVYETRSFDTFGNLLSHRDETGLTTTNTYYPADSTQEQGCPPGPEGYYVCHLKYSQVKPQGSTDALKTQEFKYKKVDGFSYRSPVSTVGPVTVRPYMVRVIESKVNGVIMSTADYISATEETAVNARAFVGMAQWEKIPSLNKPYIITYNYSRVKNYAKVIATHRSTDAEGSTLEKSTQRTFSLCTGLTHEEQDFKGAITQYQYDAENRLIKKTLFAGTAWEQQEQYSYAYYKYINPTYGYQNVTVTTTVTGQQLTHYTNFNSQHTYTLEAAPNGEAFCVKRLQYSGNGMMTGQTEYDKVQTPLGREIVSNITTRYSYTARELTRIRYADGMESSISRNKVLNTEDHRGLCGSHYRVSYDDAGRAVSLASITNGEDGKVTTYLELVTYDSFGRKVISVNRTGGRTTYSYDNFDRLLEESVHDSDGKGGVDITTYTYDAELQNMHLVVSVSSKSKLGNQQDIVLTASRRYDGFGRLVEQGSQTFSYEQAYYDQPSRCQDSANAADTVTTFEPITLLTRSVRTTLSETPDTLLNYSYDKPTGLLSQARASYAGVETSAFQYAYNAQGLLTSTRRTYASGASVTTEKTYSLSGQRILKATNPLALEQRYCYDNLGRLWRKDYQGLGIKLTASYFTSGALARITLECSTFLSGERYLAVMDFEYDACSIESRRILDIYTNGSMKTVLDTACVRAANGLMTSRSLSKGASATDNLDYAYTYLGAYGHLRTSTRTQGSASPQETLYNFAGGQRFSSIETTGQDTQHYTYQSDRVSAFRTGEITRQLFSDAAGNLVNGPESSLHARRLSYNAANSLVSCQVSDTGKACAYRYEPLGNLSQIINGDDQVIYIYDNDSVIGEISGDTKTLYLSVGGIMLGRYVQQGDQVALELFGTDASGTVRSVTTCLPGGQSLPTVYHDYLDFGERREW